MNPIIFSLLLLLSLSTFSLSSIQQQQQKQEQTNPLTPANLTTSTPIPSYPTIQSPLSGNLTAPCHLDISAELFGGVSAACSSLDRHRCCPVLAAWLFAAHARSALFPPTSSSPLSDDGDLPLAPDDSQKCVDSLHTSLAARNIKLPTPNATCDTVLCFCGIRLHQIGSLSCPTAFTLVAGSGGNVTARGGRGNVTSGGGGGKLVNATAAVRQLERDCLNSSYAGCTRCLQSLEKIKGGRPAKETTDRAVKMFNRDCQLMGLTWLLAKNRTAYIPTVSAVIRAVLYSSHPPTQPYKCSPDQENMPLAVDSLQIQKLDSSSVSTAAAAHSSTFHIVLFFLFVFWGV